MTISRNMKVCCVLLVIALTGSTVSSAIPRKDPKDRTLERELSDEKHYEEDGDHNTDYDHEAFLGEDESKSFEDLSPDESREKLAKIVEKIDKDKDGSVTEKELQDWVQYVQTRYLTQDTERQWKDFETDGEHLKWEAYKDKTYGFVNDGDEDDKEDKDSYAKMMVRDEKRWKAADGDKDGSLNKEEFTHFLHPEETPHMRDIVVEETIDDIDKDKDGMVDVNEYIGDMYSETDGEEPDWVQREREQFTEHRDKDKDGKLNRAEIKEWIVPEDYDHTDAEAKHLIYEADADKYSARKNEPVFESESDWDSTTEAQSPTPRASSNAPKIEFYSDEEENVKPANVKIKADHNNSTGRVRIGLAEEPAGGSKASSGRSSPATVKSAGRKHDALQAVTFTDRGQLSDDEDADRPTPRPRIASPVRSPENPPYDFSAAITEPRNTPQPQYDAPPGKDRKGSSYDPKTRQSRLGSWDDSEGEEQTLAQLRENFEKGNKEKKISINKETVEKPTWKDKLKNNKQQKNNSKKEKRTSIATSRSPNRSSKPSPVDSPTYSHDIKDDYIISVRDRNSTDFSSPPANSTWPAVTPPDKPTSYRRDEFGNYVYYFAEERTEYLYAIEDKTDIKMEQISQKVLPFVTRGAKEFFGVFQLVLSIIMIFVVEAIKFVLRSILYPLIYGVFNGLGDYVFKPMFAATFNCCIQPYLMVLFNVMLGCRTICGPLIDIFRSCAHVCVIMLKVWRLCPISITNNNHSRHVETIQDV